MLNDLATTMSGAGAGAVLPGSGADHELRRWFQQFDPHGKCEFDSGNQRMRRSAANTDCVTVPWT
jgi:hypothetical protein